MLQEMRNEPNNLDHSLKNKWTSFLLHPHLLMQETQFYEPGIKQAGDLTAKPSFKALT